MKAITLSAQRKVPKVKKKINGVEFFVALSPYFFPQCLECAYDARAGSYAIEFKYLDTEPARDAPALSDGLVTISVGRHTGRILRIAIHVDRNAVHRIEMVVAEDVRRAFDHIKPALPDVAENHRLAEEAILAHRQELSQCFAR